MLAIVTDNVIRFPERKGDKIVARKNNDKLARYSDRRLS